MKNMKKIMFFFAAFMLLGIIVKAQAFDKVYIVMTTGSDDLRGGNHAFFSLNFTDGTSSDEIPLTTNPKASGSFGQNGVVSGEFQLPDVEDFSKVKSITVRHDGSPRSGQPFDTYDNWDLKSFRISAMTDDGGPRGANLYNSRTDRNRRTSVIRFTGDTRSVVLFVQR
jgi:hypothetical protein